MYIDQIASSCLRILPPHLRARLGLNPSGKDLNLLFHTTLFDPDINYSEVEAALSPFDFGLAYERHLSQIQQQQEGIFYTPKAFVSRLVSRVLPQEYSNYPAVLDPACGGGAFLLEAFSRLSTNNDPISVLTKCIFGVDRDPTAVEITKLALIVSLLEYKSLSEIPDLSSNIRCGDALLGPQELRNELFGGGFDWLLEFSSVMEKGGFDFIIGNPPYGLSRDKQIEKAENELLKHAYSQFRRGKVNKYILFIARSLTLLNSNGKMSFVVPNAWLGISGGEAIRELLISKGSLEQLIVHDYPVFNDPNVEVVTFVVNLAHTNGTIYIQHELSPGEFQSGLTISHELCRRNPGSVIPTTWEEWTPRFLKNIDSSCRPLSDFAELFRPMIAMQAYAEGKGIPPQSKDDVINRPFDRTKKEDADCYPYLNGGDVKRFEIRWSGTYLKYGPWLAEPQTLERFSGPRIVIREVLSKPPLRINAALVEETILYNKSVLHILLGPKGTKQDLVKLLEILNSEETSLYITFRGRKSQRKIFPKLVLEDLLDLPIPPGLFNQGDYDRAISP